MTMELKIFSKEGDICNLKVEPEILIEKLKFMALGHFGACIENAIERERASRFKLILIKSFYQLNDKKTVVEEGINEHDEILLTKKPPLVYDDKKDFPMGPSISEIMVATATLSLKNTPITEISNKPHGADFQIEIRRVLITLIQTSHRLLCLNPQASHIFDQWLSKMQSVSSFNSGTRSDTTPSNNVVRLNNVNRPPIPQTSFAPGTYLQSQQTSRFNSRHPNLNSTLVNTLVEMGFHEKLVIKALLINRMNVHRATEWLLENPNDSGEINNNIPLEDAASSDIPYGNHCVNHPSETDNGVAAAPELSSSAVAAYDPNILSIHNDTPQKIIHSFRAFKLTQFEPDQQALSNLKEMGFNEKDIIEALTVHNNSEDSAREWLLEDEIRPKNMAAAAAPNLLTRPDEDFFGLPPNSPVCKALLSDPTILYGLNNPKMLLVLLNMYESFVQTRALNLGQWFNDPDAAVLLSQIFRIYHAEKYSLPGPPGADTAIEIDEMGVEQTGSNFPNNNSDDLNFIASLPPPDIYQSIDGVIVGNGNVLETDHGFSNYRADYPSRLSRSMSAQLRQDLTNSLRVDPSYQMPHSNINIVLSSSSSNNANASSFHDTNNLSDISLINRLVAGEILTGDIGFQGTPVAAATADHDDEYDLTASDYIYDEDPDFLGSIDATESSPSSLTSIAAAVASTDNSLSNARLRRRSRHHPLAESAGISSTFRDYADLDRLMYHHGGPTGGGGGTTTSSSASTTTTTIGNGPPPIINASNVIVGGGNGSSNSHFLRGNGATHPYTYYTALNPSSSLNSNRNNNSHIAGGGGRGVNYTPTLTPSSRRPLLPNSSHHRHLRLGGESTPSYLPPPTTAADYRSRTVSGTSNNNHLPPSTTTPEFWINLDQNNYLNSNPPRGFR